ncbi:MAG: hypothetical protein H0W88_10290 [Parachlamydiaceae bacterium]|nr:hypothetical protein [Parachlamydiaceae bacterium]
MNNIIISDLDCGRLHLGYGEANSMCKRLGKSMDVYQNFITKFFTKLFGYAVDIEVEGRTYCVSHISLAQHLESVGLDQSVIKDVNRLGYETIINQNAAKVKTLNDNFGENFSSAKRMDLFTKMIGELCVNNTQAVKRLIRQGAYVDREFFTTFTLNSTAQIIWTNRSALEQELTNFKQTTHFYSYTPLSKAVRTGNQSMANFLVNAKNGDVSADKWKKMEFVSKYSFDLHKNIWNTNLVNIHYVRLNLVDNKYELDDEFVE